MRAGHVVVLGGGPAGLGAALALARAGVPCTLVEADGRVGGLCRTLAKDGFRYDLGGHIPFVRDAARVRWMEELLRGALAWVPLPVACVRDGAVRPGRYLDQHPHDHFEPTPDDGSAAGYLGALVGAAYRDRVMRRYLEKVDGMPLERIPGMRARRLREDQEAPEGFWYPTGGIGALMDAMAREAARRGARILLGTRVQRVDAAGGHVREVTVVGPAGEERIPAGAVVAALPPASVAALVSPPPPPGLAPALDARAVCLVTLAVDRPRLTGEAWIQCDDPAVPFSRAAEMPNWSASMAPEGRTVLSLECYCRADTADAVWSASDDDLARECARALHETLGLLDDPSAAHALEVVRLPRAYPLVDVEDVARAARPAMWLAGIGGMRAAQGGTIVKAVEAGEEAARAAAAEVGAAAAALG